MTKRVDCINRNCNNPILPETAKKTNGFCMPCAQNKEREERQKYIKENRKDIDPFLGVNDLVEIIKLHHVKRTHDPLVRYIPFQGSLEEVYSNLTENDENRLIDLSIKEAKKGNLNYIESICLELTAFRSSDLLKLHKFMLLNNLYYPSMLFKDAKLEVIKNLLNRVNEDAENRNDILLALAWSGNKDVVSIFSSWMKEPPIWSSQLYIPAYDYSKEAGWAFLSTSEVRKLYFDKCYSLLPVKDNTLSDSLSSCTLSENKCEWCGNNLTNLLELNLSGKEFDFLGINGNKLQLSTCEACVCYAEVLYMDVDTNGNAKWSKFNDKQECEFDNSDEVERLPENCFTLSNNNRPPFYAANEFLPTSFSQIGGMPTWIQDSAYPDCPTCKKTMTFIAQISNEEIEEYTEGTYYIYFCSDCNISATNYQQT